MRPMMDDSPGQRLRVLGHLRDRRQVFEDRRDAGEHLLELLDGEVGEDAVLLAMVPGGVPVARPVADGLDLPLELALTATLTPPWGVEPIYGAVAWDGSVQFDHRLVEALALDRKQISLAVERAYLTIADQAELFYASRPRPILHGRDVVLVSDGAAAVLALEAAIAAARNAGAERVLVATATGTRRDLQHLLKLADGAFCASMHVTCRFSPAIAYDALPDVELEEAALLCAREHRGAASLRRGPRQAGSSALSVTSVAVGGGIAE